MKKYLPFIVSPFVFASCLVQRPIYKETAKNNVDYKVAYLFQHEGCKVYRFVDRGNYVYFTNCDGTAIARTDSSIVSMNSTGISKP